MNSDDILFQLEFRVSEYAVHPTIPNESKEFFLDIIDGFNGTGEECIEYIVRETPNWFRSLSGELPGWIQTPRWPFSDGKPMLYVGQLEASRPGYQDSVFFLFWNPENGEFKVVHQMY